MKQKFSKFWVCAGYLNLAVSHTVFCFVSLLNSSHSRKFSSCPRCLACILVWVLCLQVAHVVARRCSWFQVGQSRSCSVSLATTEACEFELQPRRHANDLRVFMYRDDYTRWLACTARHHCWQVSATFGFHTTISRRTGNTDVQVRSCIAYWGMCIVVNVMWLMVSKML